MHQPGVEPVSTGVTKRRGNCGAVCPRHQWCISTPTSSVVIYTQSMVLIAL
jgi:hypothetical protein